MLALDSILPLAASSLLFALTGWACTPTGDACDSKRPGIICTIAGTGESGYDIDGDTTDYPALQASLSLPMDTLTAPDGTIYVIDWNNHRLRAVRDEVITWVAGTGELGGSLDDPAENDFNHPSNIIFDETGENIYVAAWHNSKIRTLNLSTGTVENMAGDGKRAYFGDGGPALSASFDLPSALALNPEGELVIMDQSNQVLRAIDSSGVIRRIAGQCLVMPFDAQASDICEAPVQCPDGENGPSGKMACGGDMSLCNTPCRPGYGGDEVTAAEMRMAQPFGAAAAPSGRMLFDEAGNLFFTDTSNHLIRRIDSNGVVHRVAGTAPIDGIAQRGYAGDGGDAREALLDSPVDLALADDGTLYFSDVRNHCVRAVAPDSTITTVVGVCGEKGYAGDDGPSEEALLTLPFGVEWSNGRLLISDTGNHVIRSVRVTP